MQLTAGLVAFLCFIAATARADDARLTDTRAYVAQATGADPPASASPSSDPPARWLLLGGVTTPGSDPTRGLRMELDVFGLGPLALGGTLSLMDATHLEGAATLTASLGYTRAGWHLRGFGGAGYAVSSSDAMTAAPTYEVGLRLGRQLVGQWALAAGPTYTLTRGDAMTSSVERTTVLVGLAHGW